MKLKSAPLLQTAVIENGQTIIDEEAKKALLTEQAEVIEKLTALSGEIKIVATYKMVLNAIAFTAPSELASKNRSIRRSRKT